MTGTGQSMMEEFDNYFKETDPAKRKEILDGLEAEAGTGPASESDTQRQIRQIRGLFSLRYEKNKKGEYIDHFIGCMMTLRDVAFNAGKTLSKKKSAQRVREAVHTLCLDRQEEFPEDILYRELYHLVSFYVDVCYEDHQYNSVFMGMGWMKTDSLISKIRKDLSLIWEQIPAYLGDHEEYRLFENVIEDVLSRQLEPDPRRRRR